MSALQLRTVGAGEHPTGTQRLRNMLHDTGYALYIVHIVPGCARVLLYGCQLTVESMGFDRLATIWGALELTLSDTAAVQGAQSTLGLLGLITPLWLSVF